MLSLILPTYNESENLAEVVTLAEEALAGIDHEIIVVDDDSPDGTWRVAHALARERPNVQAIRRVGRRGLASAVVDGFLAAKGDVLAVADADGQHDLRRLGALHDAVRGGANLALGSRYVEGGGVGEWDERRFALSRLATRLATSLCRVKVADPMSGYFAIDRPTFESVLPALNPTGFKILLDVLVHLSPGAIVREVPVVFGRRRHGESKLSPQVQVQFLEYLYDVTLGRLVPLTLVKYGIVGTLGVAVHWAAYLAISRLVLREEHISTFGFSLSVLGAIETAIVFNFLLNNAWTFRQERLRGRAALVGFLKFNVACLAGALVNYAVATLLFSRGWPEAGSVLLGASVGAVWNYTVNRLVTWRG